jgi:hypothetical protein
MVMKITMSYGHMIKKTPDPIVDAQIEYEDLICSFVVDSSGSMGLTDRYNNRFDFVDSLITRFADNYPSDIKFDFFSFGGSEIDLDTITTGLGRFETINLDLTVPNRTTYVFTVSGASAHAGAVYENDGANFTVQNGLQGGDSLITFGDTDPIDAGTLNLVSGTGDATIDFGGFAKVTINDPMIAYGFKTLEGFHTYNIGELKVDGTLLSPVGLTNWQLFYPASESATITSGLNGPGDSSSVDITASQSLISRKLLNNLDIKSTEVLSILEIGSTSVIVSDASDFSAGDVIDIVSGSAANLGRTIETIVDETITFTPAVTVKISNNDLEGSIVQTSTFNRTKSIGGATANLFVRDVDVSQDIIFYLQNSSGYYIEWDFRPYEEWVKNSIYWLGETAILPIELKELDGTPFPDGTKVELLVDKEPDIVAENKAASTSVTTTAAVGETKIYVASLDGYSREQIIDITDKDGNIQTTEIVEIGEDEGGLFIEIADALIFEVSLENGSRITPNATAGSVLATNAKLALELAVVDVTPVVNDKSIDPSLLKPYDIDRVPPSTPYEDLNTDPKFIQKQTVDMPTIDGNAVVRVLPITEDILETVAEKEEDLNRSLRVSAPPDILSQLERNTGDSETVTTISVETTTEETTTEETTEGEDFIIETPVFTLNGLATSSMKSTAIELTEKTFEGVLVPGIGSVPLLSKTYTIYPSAELISDNDSILAKVYLEPFDVDFVPPIYIDSEVVDQPKVEYFLSDDDAEGCFSAGEYNLTSVQGVYASGDGFAIDYVVTDELILASSNTVLNITLYTNRVADLDELASSIDGQFTEQFLNLPQPPSTTVDADGNSVTTSTQTEIDTWRQTVQNNPFEELISDTGETDASPSADAGASGHRDNIINNYTSLVGGELSEETTAVSSVFYTNPLEWTLANQYDQVTYSLPLTNGKATLTIPSSDVVSLLMIEASVSFGDNNESEQIRADMMFIANPVRIGGLSPYAIIPAENEIYEIGVGLFFGDGSSPISDNTTVNFSLSTNAEPSTSVTDDGWAGGIFVGPHDPIPSEQLPPDEICPPTEAETVTIEVFHSSGYVRKVTRKILWYGKIDQEDVTDTFLFFASDATSSSWADGSVVNGSTVTADLNDDLNPTDLFVGEDGVDRLQGEGQPNGLPRPVRVISAIPAKTTWENGKVEMSAAPFNKNIGHKQSLCQGEKLKEPWDAKVNAVTSYLLESGTYRRGELASGLPFLSISGGIVIPKPVVRYQEPLGITMELETTFTRNGVASPIVVADVTWKGQPITNQFIKNEGTEFETTIQYPFPNVTFQSGICLEVNGSIGECPQILDTRGLISDCLVVGEHQSGQLTTYAQQAGLIRTDAYTSGLNSHKHVTEVDANGNGTTTSTVVIGGTVSSHTHVITNYEVQTADGHSHDLRCVAVTQLKPTDDISTDLVVNGYVTYDPTNAEPYGSEPSVEGQNRKMFTTLALPSGSILEKELVIQVEIGDDLDTGTPNYILDFETDVGTAPTFYTASSITDTIRGFDVRVKAKFAEYTYLDDVGDEIVVPEEIVEDGSRITVEFTPFKPEPSAEDTDSGYPVMSAGLKRDYMVLKVKVSVGVDGYFASKDVEINIVSIAQWFPSVKQLVPTLTDDSIYITNALNSFGFFGASQIHDAVKKAAQQIVQWR